MSANVFPGGASISGEDGFLTLASRGVKYTNPGSPPADCIGFVTSGIVGPGAGFGVPDAVQVTIPVALTVGPGVYLITLSSDLDYSLGAGLLYTTGMAGATNCAVGNPINQVSFTLSAVTTTLYSQATFMLIVTGNNPVVNAEFTYDSVTPPGNAALVQAASYAIVKIA